MCREQCGTGEKHPGWKGISPKAVYSRKKKKSSKQHIQQTHSKKDEMYLLFQNWGWTDSFVTWIIGNFYMCQSTETGVKQNLQNSWTEVTE